MKDDIQHLIQLQEIAFEIRDLSARRDSVPKRLEELEQAFQQRLEEIGADRLTHETLVQERAALREAEAENMQRLEKAQQKLMQVSNQREYSAVLNEIDLTKHQLTEIAAQIGARDERIEELAGPAAEADERIAAEREKTDTTRAQIDQEQVTIMARLEELTTMRAGLVEKLPAPYVRRFDAVFKARGGIAMARIDSGACSACHVRLRPQVIALVRRGNDLVACESCRRLLYIKTDPEAEEAAEDSPARPPAEESGGGLAGQRAPAGS